MIPIQSGLLIKSDIKVYRNSIGHRELLFLMINTEA